MLSYSDVLKQLDSSFPDDFNGEVPANLLCLSVPKNYIDSEVKVMFFGQETNDWGTYSDEDDEETLKKAYDDFFTSKNCFSYGGQFWNGVSRTANLLELRSGKSVGLLWNNIVKIGKAGDKGRPNKQILDWQNVAMSFILEELEAAKPDVVIFFTGPNYDDLLNQVFEDISFQKLSGKDCRQLSIVNSKFLPKKAIRTYHPNYLWRNDIDSYLNDIVDYILEEN